MPYSKEFRRDVVARQGDAPLSQIAKDVGISEATLHNWLKTADIEDGIRPGVPRPRSVPKMIYPLVLDLAADGIPVAVTCGVLGFSTQAFYTWRQDHVSQRDWDNAHLINAHLINAAFAIHADDPAFRYRFIAVNSRLEASSPARTRCNECAHSSGSGRPDRTHPPPPAPPTRPRQAHASRV